MKMFWVKKIIKGIVLFLVFATLFSFVVMWLWNMIIPSVTGWTVLTFWQAAGLIVLSKILFGFRGGWGRHWEVIRGIIISGKINGTKNYRT